MYVPSVSWNYRLVRQARPGGGETFSIHEAFYESDFPDLLESDPRKKPSGIVPEPHQPLGLTIEELQKELKTMLTAFEKEPVEGGEYHVKVRYQRKRNKTVAEDLNRRLRAAEKEARDWKKQYLKANSERIDLQKKLEEAGGSVVSE